MKFNSKSVIALFIITSAFMQVNAAENSKNNDINSATLLEEPKNISKTASDALKVLPRGEVINTLYPDPLSEDFMEQGDTAYKLDREKSTAELLSEFDAKAKTINDNTFVPEEKADNHTLEDRRRIEAKADSWLKTPKGRKPGEEPEIDDSQVIASDTAIASDSVEVNDSSVKDNEAQIKIDDSLEKVDASKAATDKPKSTGSINDAVLIEQTDDNILNDDDPEFASDTAVVSDNEVSEEPVDNSELPDEIPDYSNLSGEIMVDEDKTSEKEENKSDIVDKKVEEKEETFEKTAPIDPVLLTQGKPKSEDDETIKVHTLVGLLVPERQPLSRRKVMTRWVLELEDGSRIPVKSNLKLMQEVKKGDLIDDYVEITGKMRSSGFDKGLKYLIPEKIAKGSAKGKANKTKDSALENHEIGDMNSSDVNAVMPSDKASALDVNESGLGETGAEETASSTKEMDVLQSQIDSQSEGNVTNTESSLSSGPILPSEPNSVAASDIASDSEKAFKALKALEDKNGK